LLSLGARPLRSKLIFEKNILEKSGARQRVAISVLGFQALFDYYKPNLPKMAPFKMPDSGSFDKL